MSILIIKDGLSFFEINSMSYNQVKWDVVADYGESCWVSNSGSVLDCHGRKVGLSFGNSSSILALSSRSLDVKSTVFF